MHLQKSHNIIRLFFCPNEIGVLNGLIAAHLNFLFGHKLFHISLSFISCGGEGGKWGEKMRVFFTLTQIILCLIFLRNKVCCVPAATERENGKNIEWLFHHGFHLNWYRALFPLGAGVLEALMAYVREPMSYRQLSYIKVKFLDIFMGIKQFLSNLYSHPRLTFV